MHEGEGENERSSLGAQYGMEIRPHTSFPISSSVIQELHVVLGRGLDAQDGSKMLPHLMSGRWVRGDGGSCQGYSAT